MCFCDWLLVTKSQRYNLKLMLCQVSCYVFTQHWLNWNYVSSSAWIIHSLVLSGLNKQTKGIMLKLDRKLVKKRPVSKEKLENFCFCLGVKLKQVCDD